MTSHPTALLPPCAGGPAARYTGADEPRSGCQIRLANKFATWLSGSASMAKAFREDQATYFRTITTPSLLPSGP